MKELTDELLNKFIDGELDSQTVKELKELINMNPEALSKLKAHKLVDNGRLLYRWHTRCA